MKVKILTHSGYSFGNDYVGKVFEAEKVTDYLYDVTLVPTPDVGSDTDDKVWPFLNDELEVVEE